MDECQHENAILCSEGGMHFDEGIVWDDIRDYYYCLDCGKELPNE